MKNTVLTLKLLKMQLNVIQLKSVCWCSTVTTQLGFTVSDDIKYQLAKLLHERDIYLIEDDVYEELYFDHKKPLSMKYFDQKIWFYTALLFQKP